MWTDILEVMISGVVGGIIMNAWSFFSYHVLHITTMRFVDGAGILLTYSLICSFWIYAVPKLYQMPQFKSTPFKTTLSNNIGAIIWGATLAITLILIEKLYENSSLKDVNRKYAMNRSIPSPARKRK